MTIVPPDVLPPHIIEWEKKRKELEHQPIQIPLPLPEPLPPKPETGYLLRR